MKTFRIVLALWLLAASTLPARADIVHQDAPGLTLYARIRTSSTTSVTAVLTEGTSNGVGYYVAADSLIDDVLTTAGTYPFKVFSGSPSASADHPLRGVGTLTWTGANETTPADNRVVKLIGTGDNAETIIEAASAGTLCRLSAGAHTINAEIAIPSGVDVVGAGRTATTISGDPGIGTNAIFRVNGNNRFSNFSATANNDGAIVATTAAGAACDLTFDNVYAKGDDDCVLMYVTSSGRHRLTANDSVFDCTAWDGIGIVAANADVFLNRTRFLGGFRPIQVLLAGNVVNLTLDNVVFDMTSAGSGLECLSLQTTNNADRILCRCRGVDFYAPLGKIAVLANTGGSTGVVTLEDLGGCNFDASKMTITPGSGTATFTRVYPYFTWEELAASHATSGTLGKTAADILDDTGTSGVQIPSGEIVAATFGAGAIDATAIAADAIGASEIAANAITDAEVASDVTIASVTGNVGGNVTGSVASVVGAVGSVTGNLGGNVTGSVGSVATGGITAASLAADAITAAKVASDVTTELQTGLATAASVSSVASAVTTVDTVVDGIVVTLGTPADTIADDIAGIEGGGGGGTVIPVNQVAVGAERTFALVQTANGWRDPAPRYLTDGDSQVFAFDFAKDLPTNGRLADVSSVAISSGTAGGVTFAATATDPGVDKTQGKVTITGVTAGTYTIKCVVTYQSAEGGGTRTGYGTLIVLP